jgi:drug/metabolite transporter (DMT)-like permease
VFQWYRALKRGDPRTIGTLAYLTPLASTSLIALFGGGRLGAISVVRAGLIVDGAVVGTWSLGLASRPGP